jgi:hypothetical protein
MCGDSGLDLRALEVGRLPKPPVILPQQRKRGACHRRYDEKLLDFMQF